MPRGSFMRRDTLVLFPGNQTVEVSGSAVPNRERLSRLSSPSLYETHAGS